MSEKQFYIFEDNIRGNFGEVDKPLNNTEVVDLLNTQQSTIEEKDKEIEEWEFSFRTEMAHNRVAEKELQEKIREKQAITDELQANIQYLLDSKKELIEKIGEQQTTISALKKENEEYEGESEDMQTKINVLYNEAKKYMSSTEWKKFNRRIIEREEELGIKWVRL